PFIETRNQLAKDLSTAQDKQQKAVKLFENERLAKQRWSQMLTSGLNANSSTAESTMQRSLEQWAQQSGLRQQSTKTERSESDKQFKKIVFRVTAEGNMDSVAHFLYQIQNSPTPARVTDIQVSAKKENIDDLTVNIGVSTLFLAPEAAANANASAALTVK